MRTTRSRTLVVALAAAFALAACGGDDAANGDAASGDGDTLAVVGQDNLTWNTESLSAPAGTITFELTCEDEVNHNLVIEETDQEVVACAPGETATGSVELDAGDYTYICTVPGHEATMRGQLSVS
jgi:plastocyanin